MATLAFGEDEVNAAKALGHNLLSRARLASPMQEDDDQPHWCGQQDWQNREADQQGIHSLPSHGCSRVNSSTATRVYFCTRVQYDAIDFTSDRGQDLTSGY